MTLRITLSVTALSLALASTAVAAPLPLAQAAHSGTFVCSWPEIQRSATFVIDAQQSSMLVDRGTYQVAGFFQVATDERATVYSLGDGNQSGKISFTRDGQAHSGTATCERKD